MLNNMIEKNKHYTAVVSENGFGGEGIVKTKDGFTVFVPFALKGEEIEYRVVKVLSSHAYGKLIKIIKASKQRKEPVCSVFNRCGGCNFLHMEYGRQKEIKYEQVKSCMKKYANLEPEILPVIGMDNPFNYRNKAMYQVDKGNVGFYAPRSHDLISFNKCYMQNPLDEKIIEVTKEYCARYNAPIRTLFTRYGENCCMVTLVTYKEKLPAVDFLISRLKKISPLIVSIMQNINTDNTNTLLGKTNKTLYGSDTITAKIGNVKLKISPHSFLQINPIQTEELYSTAKKLASFSGDETIFDLYCGAGSIGLFMADSVKRVIGVESVLSAIDDANFNKAENKINNIEFIHGNSEDILPKLINSGIIPDAVILDPPRKGCDESLIKLLDNCKIKKIIYISCNPATLARDIALLKDNYTLSPVQPVDMFPNTSHVECCVLLCRTRSD